MDKELLRQEMERRGLGGSTDSAPTPTVQNPQGASAAPSPEGGGVMDTMQDYAGGFTRGYAGALESGLNMVTAVPRAVGNYALDKVGSQNDIPAVDLGEFASDRGEGTIAGAAGEYTPATLAALGVGAGLKRGAVGALKRGAARVAGKATTAGTGASSGGGGTIGAVTTHGAKPAKGLVKTLGKDALIGAEIGGAAGAISSPFRDEGVIESTLSGAADGAQIGLGLGTGSAVVKGLGKAKFGLGIKNVVKKMVEEGGGSQLSRRMISERVRKMYGDKAAMYTYNALAPSSRAHIKRTVEKVIGRSIE